MTSEFRMSRNKARIAGALYLACGMAYSFARSDVRGAFVVPGDAAATARNVLANEALFRWGFAAEMFSAVAYLAVALLLHEIFKPVSRSVSLAAAFFCLVGCATQALSSLLHLAPVIVLGNGRAVGAGGVEHLQTLALLCLGLRDQASSVYMVFFGWYCLLIGYLIVRSTFLPHVVGVFMGVAGLVYQIFLSPPLAAELFPYVVAPAGALGELSLILWLLIFGVNPRRWMEQANGAGTGAPALSASTA